MKFDALYKMFPIDATPLKEMNELERKFYLDNKLTKELTNNIKDFLFDYSKNEEFKGFLKQIPKYYDQYQKSKYVAPNDKIIKVKGIELKDYSYSEKEDVAERQRKHDLSADYLLTDYVNYYKKQAYFLAIDHDYRTGKMPLSDFGKNLIEKGGRRQFNVLITLLSNDYPEIKRKFEIAFADPKDIDPTTGKKYAELKADLLRECYEKGQAAVEGFLSLSNYEERIEFLKEHELELRALSEFSTGIKPLCESLGIDPSTVNTKGIELLLDNPHIGTIISSVIESDTIYSNPLSLVADINDINVYFDLFTSADADNVFLNVEDDALDFASNNLFDAFSSTIYVKKDNALTARSDMFDDLLKLNAYKRGFKSDTIMYVDINGKEVNPDNLEASIEEENNKVFVCDKDRKILFANNMRVGKFITSPDVFDLNNQDDVIKMIKDLRKENSIFLKKPSPNYNKVINTLRNIANFGLNTNNRKELLDASKGYLQDKMTDGKEKTARTYRRIDKVLKVFETLSQEDLIPKPIEDVLSNPLEAANNPIEEAPTQDTVRHLDLSGAVDSETSKETILSVDSQEPVQEEVLEDDDDKIILN